MHNEEDDPTWGSYAADCIRQIPDNMRDRTMFTIALPEGKNLGQQTLDLLRDARIIVKRGHPRAIEGQVEGIPGITRAIFCRPEQVNYFVARGIAQFGITGKDVVLEHPDDNVELWAELLYSRQTAGGTRCVLFTRADNPVNTVKDLKALLSTETEAKIGDVNGGRRMIASDYPAETKAFLAAQRLNLEVASLRGSSEVFVFERVCDYGVALVETGATLAANGLKEIQGGKIFDSSAVLIGNRYQPGSNLEDTEIDARRPLGRLLAELLNGTLEARSKVLLVMNAPAKNLAEIEAMLPAMKSPTVTPLANPGFCSVSSVVSALDVNGLIGRLSERGATDFLTMPLSTVM